MWAKQARYTGFTIVELLIVIVVIAIIAAISIVAYSGIQERARTAKINTDLALFDKAIQSARINSSEVALRYITNSTGTAGSCTEFLATVDFANKTDAASCWSRYEASLAAISDASNINIRNLVDPWGRPYFLDENEKEGVSICGNGRDMIGVYLRPRVQSSWATTNTRYVPYITPGC